MGRGRRIGGLADRPKKRKKVTVQLIKRVHAGEVVEPYRLMEEIRAKEHGHLEGVKIALAWRLGWRPDANNILCLGKCRKRGDLDRELDDFDFVILLNKEAWQGLNEKERRALVDHELCHAQVVMDADGNPKHDDRDRLVCRIRKHDTEEFKAVVERHGLWTNELAAIAQAAINDSRRPLLTDEPGGNGQPISDWRTTPVDKIGFREADAEKLAAADIRTAGELQDEMTRYGVTWNHGVRGIGEAARERVEDAFNAFVTAHDGKAGKAAKEA